MWAPAVSSQLTRNVLNSPTSEPRYQPPTSAPSSPHSGRAPPPTAPSAGAANGSVRGREGRVRPTSRTRSPSVAELAMEVETAVLERSHHGSREPSGHGGTAPHRSRHGSSRPQSKEPSRHGREPSTHSRDSRYLSLIHI